MTKVNNQTPTLAHKAAKAAYESVAKSGQPNRVDLTVGVTPVSQPSPGPSFKEMLLGKK